MAEIEWRAAGHTGAGQGERSQGRRGLCLLARARTYDGRVPVSAGIRLRDGEGRIVKKGRTAYVALADRGLQALEDSADDDTLKALARGNAPPAASRAARSVLLARF